MLYPLCPTCGTMLSNIQLPYQRDLKKICEKYNIDHEVASRGVVDDEKFNDEKEKIVNKYIDKDRYCCKMRLINFSDIVRL
jgi:DNA-directed RNA polymerase subunit N (RpoN/RPB10)